MGRTLLVGNPGVSWREWIKSRRIGRDWICLDPVDPSQGLPARVSLFKGEHPVVTRFVGSLDAQRAPLAILGALPVLLEAAGPDAIVQSFAYRPSPVLRQTLLLLAQIVRPEDILVACGTSIDLDGFPVGPHEVEVDKAFPPMVQGAQRKAQWMKLLERCEEHEVDLRRVTLEGARLGGGRAMDRGERERMGLAWAAHAEIAGNVLLVVADGEPEEHEISRALDQTHCGRAHFLSTDAYDGLLCAFARQDGEDFGTGVIQAIDWENHRAHILCDAVPPAPVRLLRIGALRISPEGDEQGEIRPWQV
jgi:hypothetical protein